MLNEDDQTDYISHESTDLVKLGKEYAKIDRAYKSLQDELSALEEIRSKLKQQLIDEMVIQETESLRIKGSGLIYISSTPRLKITDPVKLRKALHEKGLESLLTVNSQTLNAFWKNEADGVFDESICENPELIGLSKTEFLNIGLRKE